MKPRYVRQMPKNCARPSLDSTRDRVRSVQHALAWTGRAFSLYNSPSVTAWAKVRLCSVEQSAIQRPSFYVALPSFL